MYSVKLQKIIRRIKNQTIHFSSKIKQYYVDICCRVGNYFSMQILFAHGILDLSNFMFRHRINYLVIEVILVNLLSSVDLSTDCDTQARVHNMSGSLCRLFDNS